MKRFLRILLSAVMLICFMASVSLAYTFLDMFDDIPVNANVDEWYEANFYAIGGVPPYSWSYSGTLPPGLDFFKNGDSAKILGYPTKKGNYSFYVTVRDSSGQRALSSQGNVMVFDPADSPPSIVKTSLNGVPGKSYSGEVSSETGRKPLIWEIISGALPPGIEFVNKDNKAVFSGNLTDEEGTYTFTLKVTDKEGRTDEQQMTFKVFYPPLSLSGELSEGVPNEEYSAVFYANNGVGACTWEFVSGKLPSGLMLITSGDKALLSGKPLYEGTYPFTLKVTDSKGRTDQKEFALKIYYPPMSLSYSLLDGVPNEKYSARFYTHNEVSPCKWEIVSGKLPSGITLNTSGDEAFLSGTPLTEGTYPFTIKVTDARGRSEQKALTLNIYYPSLTLSGSPSLGFIGSDYDKDFWVNGGAVAPYTWRISDGVIPPGLNLNVTGDEASITGIPISPDTYDFTLSFTDGRGRTAEKDFSIRVAGSKTDYNLYIDGEIPDMSFAPKWRNTKYDQYSTTLYAKGGRSPYEWSIIAGSIPKHIKTEVLYLDKYALHFYGTATGDSLYAENEFIVKVVDADGRTVIKKFCINVPDGLPGGSKNIKAPYTIPEITGDFAEATEGKSYSSVVTAIEGTAPYRWSVTDSVIPDGLALSFSDSMTGTSTGTTGKYARLTGTPKIGGQYASFTLKVTDANGNTSVKSFTVKVVQTPTIISIVKDSTIKSTYFGAGAVLGGTAPYTWKVSKGSLPEGLALVTEEDNGISTFDISGTVSKAGQYSFTLTVTDSNGLIASKAYNITITQPKIWGNPATSAARGSEYLGSLTVSGGAEPYTWSVVSGDLPDGLTFTASGDKVEIASTPSKPGTFKFTVKARDANGAEATKALTIKVTQATLSGTLPTAGIRNASYTGTLKASGGTTPYTWSISSGALPDGLKINQDTGKITGKPTKAGTFKFTVQVADEHNVTAAKAFTVKVTQVTMNGKLPTTGIRKVSYTGTLSASNGTAPYKWTVSEGKLPDGLKINASTGQVSGMPTKAGTFKFTVKVTDKNNAAATKAFTVKVTQTTLALTVPTTIVRGKSYTWTPKVTGGTSAYKWSISKGKLPDGLSINSSTGKITGKPTKAGTFNFTVKVTDKNNIAATKAFTVKVTQTTLNLTVPTTIVRGKSYTWTPKVTGGTSAYKWTISKGSLPNGMKISASTGKITGKPTKAGTFNFTVKVTDKNNVAATKAFTVKVTQTTLTLTVPTTIIRGKSYTWTPKVAGGTSAYTWTISKGKLPNGLSINASTGKITGKPSKAGTFNFTVKVTDKNNIAATKAFTVKVTQTTMTATIPATIIRGKSYTWTLKASGGTSAYTWTISKGSLPTGMKINASTGKITGKPTKTGKFSFTVKVKDKNNIAATKVFTVKVTESASTTAQTLQTKNSAQLETGTSSINSLKSSTPETLQTEELTGIQGNGAINLAATLNVSSDDVVEAYEGKDSDLVKVKAGKDLTFIVGDWGVDVSNVTVYVNENALEGITLEDNKFTLPPEIVHDDFKVSVKAQSESGKLESEEVYVISE